MSRSRQVRPASQDIQPFAFEFSRVPGEPNDEIEASAGVAPESPPTRPDILQFALEQLVSTIDAIDELRAGVAPDLQRFAGAPDEISSGTSDPLPVDGGSPALTDEFGAATVSLHVRLPELAALPSVEAALAPSWFAGAAPSQALDILPSHFGTGFAAQVVPVASGIHALDCAAGDGGNGFSATAADPSAPMACCSCCVASAAASEAGSGFDDYATSGTKWGNPGLGSWGGTVTWSIAAAGLTNATGQGFFSGSTVSLSSVFNFDYEAVLTQAFAAWSAVANITFVRVADGGGNIGTGATGYIRICAGYIDGGSNVLARAFYPVTNGNAQSYAVSGDAVFDSGETSFWTASSLLAVATHEIGHSIGLNHSSVSNAIMAPYYNASITTPRADDIAGAQAIYGAATSGTAAGSVSISDVSISEGNSGTKTMTFTVARTGGTAAFSVNYATADNSATAGSDYVARSGALSFGAGVNSQTFTVTVNGDALAEADERFFVNLSGATNGATVADGQGIGTITNDDSAGSVSIDNVSITEGNSSTKTMTFTVTRTGGTAAFNVNYATANDTATAGSDYVARSGTLSFGAGVNSKTFTVTVNGDRLVEPDERFFVNLSGATNGATIADSRGVGTIANDDAAGSISINNVSVTEGNSSTKTMTFTVTRTGGTAAFDVNYATADNSAAAGSDYVARSGTLSFAAGINSKTFTVAVNGDTLIESNETFLVNLSGATNGATIADGQGTGTITNDDGAGSISIGNASITEGNSSTKTMTFTVTRTGGTSAFNVNYATADNTAAAGSDYVARSGTLSFAAGVNSKTLTVTVNGDTATESSETFFVDLSGATGGAAIADGQGVGTITNDDLGSGDDYADSRTDTTAPFGTFASGVATGNLETAGDRDWFRVSLNSGAAIVIDLLGADTGNGTLSDPYLRFYDSAGTRIGADDDSGAGLNSRLSFTVTANGTYYIAAGSYNDAGSGTYRVTWSSVGSSQADRLADDTRKVEQVTDSRHDDVLTGNGDASENYSRVGNDLLSGDAGQDVLIGGDGRDTFLFAGHEEDGDRVKDFISGEDLIGIVRSGYDIDAGVDLGIGGEFDFASHYFVSNATGAADAVGHGQFIFNQSTDRLFWDPDGLGSRAAGLVAAFDADVNLQATDFVLI